MAPGSHGHEPVLDSHLFQLERVTHIPEQTHRFDLQSGFIAAPSGGDPLDVAFEYLQNHAGEFGITATDITTSTVTNHYTSAHNGVTHIYLAQTHNGLPVANTSININVGPDGQVINAGSNFVPGLFNNFVGTPSPFELTAAEALALVAPQLGVTDAISPILVELGSNPIYSEPRLSLDDIPMQPYYVPTAAGGAVPAWNMILRMPDGQHWFDLGVDASTGEIVSASNWIDNATYRVFAPPLEAPDDDPLGMGTIVPRTLETDPLVPTASPFGWHDVDGAAGADTTDTRGNNVFAQEDADADNELGFRPNGGSQRIFDFGIDFTQEPSIYVSAAITNLFYWNNVAHDVLYQYGFNEASGNFQLRNYGKGGISGDQVMADAQDGSGFNNANFGTPPDGQNPRMQQFLFDLTIPFRDSSLANEIIVHEYGHGVSNRLTGGGANSNALTAIQSGGMGEGWSDWLALMFTQKITDVANTARPAGTYVLGQSPNGSGIRRVPYSFDLDIDPQSYALYNGNSQVHAAGEIWASALWDLNWLLIDKHGYDPDIKAGYAGEGSAGNQLALQLVLDGMKLQPANPSFLDGRDAILLADSMLTGGANALEIWTAFARRGMGASADDGGNANAILVTEAFDIPIFGLTVRETVPAQESAIDTQPVDFTIHFTTDYVPSSADASDLTVNGIPATGLTLVDADTIIFHYNTSPVSVQGPQIMRIAAGALTEASDGDPSLTWQGVFFYDLTPFEIVSTTPGEGLIFRDPPPAITFDFSDPVDPASVDASDLTLSVGTVRAVTVVDADTVSFAISGIPTDEDVTVQYTLAAGAITDEHGTPGPEHIGTFVVDDINLLRVASTDVPFPILDFTTTVSTLTIPRSLIITDVDVEIKITHTFVGELTGALFAPGNPVPIRLFSFIGGGGDNFTGTVFDDQAAASILTGAPPFTGRFQPQDMLSTLNGTDAQGTWRFEVTDFAAIDEGAINAWALLVHVEEVIDVPGDTNGDGVVDIVDLNNVRNQFGASGDGILGDTFPFDGVVDIVDLNAVRNNFGQTSPLAPLVADATTAAFAAAPATRLPAMPAASAHDRFGLFFKRLGQRRALAAVDNSHSASSRRLARTDVAASADAAVDAQREAALRNRAEELAARRAARADAVSRRVVTRVSRPMTETVQTGVWDAALESLASVRRRAR